MGNYEQALRLAEEGSSLLESMGKNDSEAFLKVKSVRAIGALIDGQYDEAEILYREILLNSPRGGAAELDYAVNLGMLGTIFWYQKKYENAEKSYLEAIELFRAARDTSWGMFANLKGNLGLVYLRTGAYDKAFSWAGSTVSSYRILNGEDHPDCLNHRVNRTISLEGAGKTDAALRESFANNMALLDLIDRNLLYWSESEMESFISQYAGRFFDYHHSLWLRNAGNQPALAGRMYDNQLFLKGVLLESSRKLQQSVAAESDTLLHGISPGSTEDQDDTGENLRPSPRPANAGPGASSAGTDHPAEKNQGTVIAIECCPGKQLQNADGRGNPVYEHT